MRYYLLLFSFLFVHRASAQIYLNKIITIQAKQQPVVAILESITRQTGAEFSYNTSIIRTDSLITITAQNKTVKQTLHLIFGERMSFKERDKYIILQSADDSRFWYVSGYVVDEATGERLSEASVYEPQLLVSTLTDAEGYFRMRFKGRPGVMNLNVSKLSYNDAFIPVNPGLDQEVTVKIVPRDYTLDTVTVRNGKRIEDTWIGKAFLSSKQKVQSVNVGKFFVDKPFQISLTPGLGTHGSFNSQVINKASLNVLGGYSAGINGVEIGSLFNIVRKDMQYLQIAGLFNMVGGTTKGLQIAGVSNLSLNDVNGVQIGGVHNHVAGSLKSVQIGGVANYVDSNMVGVQIGGVVNYVRNKSRGLQLAGVANITDEEVDGVQLSGVFNYTKKLKGLQIGLINVSDSSDGYSIGLINICKNGYHKLAVYNTEVAHLNLGLKTGTRHIYTILFAGMNTGNLQRSWTFGAGLGASYKLSKKLSVDPELTLQHLYLGDWEHANLLNRVSLHLSYQFTPFFSIFGGPAYNIYVSDQSSFPKYYRSPVPDQGSQHLGNSTTGWLGWNVGLALF
ncbi:MAG TPA: carboxypeptidase-like regulatory domain-containing protein [Flavipsychrobacter sp.]|nr:carboxypeptidase-like regulatory domain-containing protein [Flavipsychrobacter sp.]